MTLPSRATAQLAALAARVAEARVRLERCRSRADGARAARNLAALVRDIDAFFAAHGAAMPAEFEASLRRDAQRLGDAILYLLVPAGRA